MIPIIDTGECRDFRNKKEQSNFMTAIAIGDSTRGAPCLRVEQCKAFSDDRRTARHYKVTVFSAAVSHPTCSVSD